MEIVRLEPEKKSFFERPINLLSIYIYIIITELNKNKLKIRIEYWYRKQPKFIFKKKPGNGGTPPIFKNKSQNINFVCVL